MCFSIFGDKVEWSIAPFPPKASGRLRGTTPKNAAEDPVEGLPCLLRHGCK